MKSVLKRKNFVVTMIVLWLMTLGGVLASASGVYFLQDVLQMPMYYYIFMSLAGFLGFVLFIPFWYNLSKRYGHVKCFRLALPLAVFGYLSYLWIITIEQVIKAVNWAKKSGLEVAGYFMIGLPGETE